MAVDLLAPGLVEAPRVGPPLAVPLGPTAPDMLAPGLADDSDTTRARMAAAIRAASNPDQAAKALQLSRQTGIPGPVVERNLVSLEDHQKIASMWQAAQGNPILMRKLTDPSFVSLAQDDTDTLGSIEKTIGGLTAYMMGSTPTGGFIGGIKAMPERATEAWSGVARAAMRAMGTPGKAITGRDNIWTEAADFWGRNAATAKSEAERIDMPMKDIGGGGAASGVQSLMANAKWLPIAMAGGPAGPAVALGAMALETFGQSFNKADDKGLPLWQSLSFASSDAVVEWWTERSPLFSMVKDIKVGTPIVQTILRNAWAENKGEQIATVLQNLNEWSTLNPEKSLAQHVSEMPAAAAQTLIGTIIGVGGNVALAESIQGVTDKIAGETAAQRAQAARAEESGAALERLAQFAAASKTLTRDSQTVREFVAEISDEDGDGATELFIDGAQLEEVLNQSGMSREEFAAVAPKAAAQLGAAAHGGLVTLPMSEFVVLGDKAAPLIDHIRVGEDMPSRAEAREYMASDEAQQLQGQVEAEMQRSGAQDADREATAGLAKRFEQELLAAGRAPMVAKSDAQVRAGAYVTLAQRAGMTLDDFVSEYKLDVVNTELQGSTMTQADTATPEFRNWFGESAVVDAAGKPLVGRALAVAMYQRGASSATVAKAMGDVSVSTVKRWVSEAGAQRTASEARGGTKENRAEAVRLYSEGLGAFEIADRIGVSNRGVYNWLRDAGVEIRSLSEAQSLRAEQGRQPIRGVRSTVETKWGDLRADSVYEAARLRQLEGDRTVANVKRAETQIEWGEGRRYTPDFVVTMLDGSVRIEEVKPTFQQDRDEVVAKAEAARAAIGSDTTDYKIVNTEELAGGFAELNDMRGLSFASEEDRGRFKRALATAKSATGNRGTYSTTDPSILNQGPTESEIVALRKRESVLKSLLECL